MSCDSNCLTCSTNPTHCESCQSSHYLNPNTSVCELIPTSCSPNYVVQGSTCVMQLCDPNKCSSCGANGECNIDLTSSIKEKNIDSQEKGVLKLELELFNNGEPVNQNDF